MVRHAPLVVITADVHYGLPSLKLADSALRQALSHARALRVPLVVAGDLHDTKAIFRGECANALIAAFEEFADVRKIVIVGNHCLINHHSTEHSLNFLRPYCEIVDMPVFDELTNLWLVPYQTDIECFLREVLHGIPAGSTLVMHQGVKGAFLGEYVTDKTSVSPEVFDTYRVVSGHYHRIQDLKCGDSGLWSFVGSPYSVTFAEANDGPKGFRILNEDGTLDFVPTNLRKHVIVERTPSTVLDPIPDLQAADLLWIKVTGPATELATLDKKAIGLHHLGHANFKLDKLPIQSDTKVKEIHKLTHEEQLDALIDSSSESKAQKTALKKLWREVL